MTQVYSCCNPEGVNLLFIYFYVIWQFYRTPKYVYGIPSNNVTYTKNIYRPNNHLKRITKMWLYAKCYNIYLLNCAFWFAREYFTHMVFSSFSRSFHSWRCTLIFNLLGGSKYKIRNTTSCHIVNFKFTLTK